MRRTTDFQTIRSEGGLLPPDLLRRVLDPAEKLDGTRPEDYGLAPGERLNEVITQSWNRMRRLWTEFRAAATQLPAGEPGTGLTNDKWTLPLLRDLGFGFLPTSAGPEVGGRTYAINRFFGPVPIHLVGCGLSLDRRAAGVRGAASVNPHGLVQEFLNRSMGHLWAILSNGLRFRVLRDNQALSRQSYLEFDLEAMFAGEVYSDFVLLWMMGHATRFTPREGDRADTCRLEQWTKVALEQGTRALGELRSGVERALQVLGEGFTSHPKNTALRDALRSGHLTPADFHGQLLRVVYRLIFLFVAEDRTIDGQPLLHPRNDSDAARVARGRYAEHYSTARLREMASRIRGSRHGDLWRQFQLIVCALSGDDAIAPTREHLALPALGSLLWNPASTAHVNDAELTNHDFLEALRFLAFTRQGKVLRPVDYRNLGAEELGGVYESLLALTPQISADGARFTFAEFAGNKRKTSGSYYTPDSLVQCLLDSALDPVVDEAIAGKSGEDAEKAILDLKVCDPAVGSGHFLVGAAHRLARHLARVRAFAQGESEPSPLLYQHALRDVIGRCLYGVDINPMAAELCRVSLWLEALEPGRPLSFLDHHIQVGNSLLDATPELIASGIPDEAFTPIAGDDRKACAVLKKRNKAEKKGAGPLFAEQDAEIQARLVQAATAMEELPDDAPEAVRIKASAFHRYEGTDDYRSKKRLADAWCAAFVIKKRFTEPGRDVSAFGITQRHLTAIVEGSPLPSDLTEEVDGLRDSYQFFHWHLAFPKVFDQGGFDCVLGNPPFLGGLKISEQLGPRVRHVLNNMFSGVTGRADLCSLMLRRGFLILAAHGRLGMVTTNTIGQGETRDTGLASIVRGGGQIKEVTTYVKWPGDANVEVILLTLAREPINGNAFLNGEPVLQISSRLDAMPETEPGAIQANKGMCFQGSIVLSTGFILADEEARRVLASDPRSRECLVPYLTGEDINSDPEHQPSRWVVQFDERSQGEAETYQLLWHLVRERVLPERRGRDGDQYPRMVEEWWKHWNNRRDLYDAVRPLRRALARSRVSEYHMLAWVRTDIVFSDACVVFAYDDDFRAGILQSCFHEIWLRREASTMRTDIRYTPKSCFLTFPFPDTTSRIAVDAVREASAAYFELRTRALFDRNVGVTHLYKLISDAECRDEDVAAIRRVIADLDRCVAILYESEDLFFGRSFDADERGRRRFFVAKKTREEIVRRLSSLNRRKVEAEGQSHD